MHDLPEGIISICKIFADDTFLFSKILDINESTKKLNFASEKITEWDFQRKMHFNPDLNKQVNEVIFLENQKSILISFLLSKIMMLRNVLIRNT